MSSAKPIHRCRCLSFRMAPSLYTGPAWSRWCTYVIDTNRRLTETAWTWRLTSRNWTLSLPHSINESDQSLSASGRCYLPKSLAWSPSRLKIKSTETCKSSTKEFCPCSITNLKTSSISVGQSSQVTTFKYSAKSIQSRFLLRILLRLNCKSVQILIAGLTVSKLYLKFKRLSKDSQFKRVSSLKKVWNQSNQQLNSNDLRKTENKDQTYTKLWLITYS